MCGVAGYVGPRAIPDDAIEQCLAIMRRRGPDHAAAKRWINPAGRHVDFLHSRLSIIDLDPRSNQPFPVGTQWMSYNGELYNYKELRAYLEGKGHRFRTASDTEVMLDLLGTEGPGALDRCEGMWAFSIYDERDGGVMLVRDRFGEKPLYLYRDRGGIYYGSEVKFIQTLLGAPLRPNHDHIQRYLVNGYKALYKQPAAFFEGVEELPPASVLQVDASGRETERRYWTPSFAPEEGMTYADAVQRVRAALIRSTELRMRADVPLAFCMSGGIDSNSLISIAKRVFGHDVHGFTLFMDDARYDERELVMGAVEELGVRHTSVPVTTANFRENLVALVRQHDAPLYTISYYIQWLLMQQIAVSGYRISISGTAADELFTGYYDHHNLYLHEVRGTATYEPALRGWRKRIAPIVRNPHLQNPDLYANQPGFREHIYLNHEEFSDYTISGWSEPFTEVMYSESLLRNRMLNEMFHEAVPVILHEDDLNAMYFSIENRSPFLDRALFELAYRIPSQHLVRDGYAKVVLRDAMQGIVPDAILWSSRKVGFNAPVESFVDFHSADTRAWLLEESPVFELVKRERIARLLEKSNLPNSESKFLFNFINSKVFLELFA